MENIITLNEFKPKNIVLKDPKKNKRGGITIPVRYICERRGEIPFLLKTPKLDLPYGSSQWPNKVDAEGKEDEVNYSLNPAFNGHDNGFPGRPKVKMFYEKLTQMEKFIHESLFKNSKKLLGKKYGSVEVVKEKCYSLIKFGKTNGELDMSKAPTFKVKVERDKTDDNKQLDTFKSVSVYDSRNQKIDLTVSNIHDTFQWSSATRGLISLYSLPVVSGNISIPIRAKQLLAYPGISNITENVFADDSDCETETVPAKTEDDKMLSDSDEGEDVVEVAPVPKTKVVSAAKTKAKAKAKAKAKPVPEPESETSDSDVEVEVDDSDED